MSDSWALADLVLAARSINADLSGNADSRVRGDMIMIEKRRIDLLLNAIRRYDEVSK